MPLFTGISIDNLKLKIHFTTTFLGVNLTFFPQHYIGLKGMPRRYVDFPDSLINLNLFSSLGSCIRIVAVLIFIIVIYDRLTKKQIII